MNITELYPDAYTFARDAHAGQMRKYTGEPYIVHPVSVATTVLHVAGSTETMVMAALLHDVVEDCGIALAEIRSKFGFATSSYVDDLTKRDHLHPGWNRDRRKAYEAGRLSAVCAASQTIKLADLIDNTRSIVWGDRAFAAVYLKEKQTLLEESLLCGDPLLLKIAREQTETALKILERWEEAFTPTAVAA
jgi:(p)ppGpp synthase/HD superfamily hydrolase